MRIKMILLAIAYVAVSAVLLAIAYQPQGRAPRRKRIVWPARPSSSNASPVDQLSAGL